MYLIALEVDGQAFRFFPYLILPVIAVAIIALLIYVVRHRVGKRGS
jgi:hypothetical protein